MVSYHVVPMSGGAPPDPDSEEEDREERHQQEDSDYDDEVKVRTHRDICILPGCNRDRQYEYGSGLDYCCKYCFIYDNGWSPPPGRHESWCDRDEAKRQARLASCQGGQPPSGHKTPRGDDGGQGRQSLFGNMTPKAAEAIAAALQARARGVREGQQSDEATAVNRAPLVDATMHKYVNYDTGAQVLCVPEDTASATSTMTPTSVTASGKGGSTASSRDRDDPRSELVKALQAAAANTDQSTIEKAILMLTSAAATPSYRDCPVGQNELLVSGENPAKQWGKGEASQPSYSQAGTHPSDQADNPTYLQERHRGASLSCSPCTVKGPHPSTMRARDGKTKKTDQSEHGIERLDHHSDGRDAAMHCARSERALPLEHRHGGQHVDRRPAEPRLEGSTPATSGTLLHVFARDRVTVKDEEQACDPWDVVNDQHSLPSLESGSSEAEAEAVEPSQGVNGSRLACVPVASRSNEPQRDHLQQEAIRRAWVRLQKLHLMNDDVYRFKTEFMDTWNYIEPNVREYMDQERLYTLIFHKLRDSVKLRDTVFCYGNSGGQKDRGGVNHAEALYVLWKAIEHHRPPTSVVSIKGHGRCGPKPHSHRARSPSPHQDQRHGYARCNSPSRKGALSAYRHEGGKSKDGRMKTHRVKQKPEPAAMREHYKRMGICYYFSMQGSCPYRHCRYAHVSASDSSRPSTWPCAPDGAGAFYR